MRLFAVIACLLVSMRMLASQANVWITQTSQGADNGNDAANAHSISWLNTQGNWGSGASQVGAGTTVHLSGTITNSNRTIGVNVLGSGTTGNPITILFESGAKLSCPSWPGPNPPGDGTYSGAILLTNSSWVDIDGGVNGMITNTANGTFLANSNSSAGVYIQSCTNINVRNLTTYLYANQGTNNTATDQGGQFTEGIEVAFNNLNIHCYSNNLFGSRSGISVGFDGSYILNIELDHNIISDHCWGISFASGSSSSLSTNVLIHDNTITGWGNWQFPSGLYHTDGIICYSTWPCGLFQPKIYNNYIYGDMGLGSATALIFASSGNGTGNAPTCPVIYNNVLAITNNGASALWIGSTASNAFIYNNTIVATKYVFGSVAINGLSTNCIVTNNICSGWSHAYNCQGAVYLTNALLAANNIVWFGIVDQFQAGDGFRNYAQYQALGYDANSYTTDPKLDANYKFTAGSSAAGNGANLSSIFTTDKAGATRSAPWDIGAYAGISDPSISVQPQNQSVTVVQTATFSVTASGQTALSYQWYKNGVSIPGATSASVSSGATSLSNNNDQYYVVVSDSAGSVQSSTAILTVNPASDFIINSVNLNVGSLRSP